MDRLVGRVAFVTGAGGGIGRETAIRYAAEGAAVAAVDVRADTAQETADKIIANGGKAIAVIADLTVGEQVDRAIATTVDELGGLDVVANIAGIDIFGSAVDLGEDDWDREMDINLKSMYLVSKAAWPHLRARGGGAIVNTGSVAALRAIADNAGYCVSKAAVLMLTKCLALSGAEENIRVNSICPGFTATEMIEGYFSSQDDPEGARAAARGLHPMGRFGHPSDIADGFVYLASDEAKWVTGSNLVIDGGLTSKM